MKFSLRPLMIAALAALSFIGSAVAAEVSDDAIAERIAPVGAVYLEGSAAEQTTTASAPRSGEAVYGTFCAACHDTGVIDAPKKGDANDWGPRLDQGLDVLTDHALNGFNAMPAKGSCIDCSDDEIIAAINHMLEGL